MNTTTNEMKTEAQSRLATAAQDLAGAVRIYDRAAEGFRSGRLSLALLISAERCACRAEDSYKAAREYMDGLLSGLRSIEATRPLAFAEAA